MKPIEMEIWRPLKDDPRRAEFVGTRSAIEVFEELKQRLDGMGLLPDEYFELAPEWMDGELLPQNAGFFITTDYGESEGIYLDAYLKWFEGDRSVTRSFFTGKTLGETGADLDRMFLISSAITKAFHGDGGQYDRYRTLHPEKNAKNMVLSLTPDEHKLFVTALVEHREKTREQLDGTEQLLRRMTGSITEYMSVVGERPLRLSDFDRTSLAIRDGELWAFKELLPRVADRASELLEAAAERAGEVGRKMTVELLAAIKQIDETTYMRACVGAVEIGDTERVQFLLEQAQSKVRDLDPAYCGRIIDCAYLQDRHMGRSLVDSAPEEWIAAAPPELLCHAILQPNIDFAYADALVRKGAVCGNRAAELLKYMTTSRDVWLAEALLKAGMRVEPDDYAALDACVCNRAEGIARILLEQGMDFDGYLEWASAHPDLDRPEKILDQLEDLWDSMGDGQAPQQPQTGPRMEMTL